MRRLALTTLLFALLAIPAAASAATSFVITGGGFGHGIGMSQYGAYGYALHGATYRQILGHYYTGTSIGTVQPRSVRVLLAAGHPQISFASVATANGQALNPAATYTATNSSGGIEIRDSAGKLVVRFGPGAVELAGPSGTVQMLGAADNGVSDGAYHGQLELDADIANGLDAINVVALDDYIAGVVGGEMSPSWPIEALRAQAVAARTYTLATGPSGPLFDQFSDTRSQEYKGVAGETAATVRAAQETSGEVVTYNGALAKTFYFSTSGGRTEDVQNVFYGSQPLPYLTSVKDPYDNLSPYHHWRYQVTAAQLQHELGGSCSGTLERIQVTKRGASGRVVAADVVCSAGTAHLTGVQLHSDLGLMDTLFTVTRITSAGTRRSPSSSLVGRLVTPRRALAGSFDPAPPGRRLVIEQLGRGGRWRRAGSVTVSQSGAFIAPLRGAGTYRVRYKDIVGPAVRVR